MLAVKTADESKLPRLKRLASDLLAASAPEATLLDQIASLAAEMAAHCRERARLKLLDAVRKGALAILPSAGAEIAAALAGLSADELSEAAALLETAAAARADFERVDAELMAAHQRGDYAAMAPLALEASAQKAALAKTRGEFADRLGLDLAPTASPEPEPADTTAAGPVLPADPPSPGAPVDPAPAAAAAPEPAGPAVAAMPAARETEVRETLPERRRLRALIRQIRPVAEEATVSR